MRLMNQRMFERAQSQSLPIGIVRGWSRVRSGSGRPETTMQNSTLGVCAVPRGRISLTPPCFLHLRRYRHFTKDALLDMG